MPDKRTSQALGSAACVAAIGVVVVELALEGGVLGSPLGPVGVLVGAAIGFGIGWLLAG